MGFVAGLSALLMVLVGCGRDKSEPHIDRSGVDQVDSLVKEISSAVQDCEFLFAIKEDVLVPTDFTPEDEERITTAFIETNQRLQCGLTP